MPSGPYIKSLQGVANAAGALAPPQRALVLGDGLAWEDAPSVVLTGGGQSITGATRITAPGLASSAVYRYDSGANAAIIGPVAGLSELRITKTGGGYVSLVATTGTLTFTGTFDATGVVRAGADFTTATGYVISGEQVDAVAIANAATLTGGAYFWASSTSHTIKAADKDSNVTWVTRPAGFPESYAAATTVGTASAAAGSIAFPDDSSAKLHVWVMARCVAIPAAFETETAAVIDVSAGSLTFPAVSLIGPGVNSFGLPPSGTVSWSAGVLSLTVTGPIVHVTATADLGGTDIQITVTETVSAFLTGMSITGAGIGGTANANGVKVATYIDGHNFSVPGVHAAWTSGGTFVLTTPPTIHYKTRMDAVVAT